MAEKLATRIAFHRDSQLAREFYAWRRELIATCKPNQAYLTFDFTLTTQNVHSLHTAAGVGEMYDVKLFEINTKETPISGIGDQLYR